MSAPTGTAWPQAPAINPQRGEIWSVELDPVRGSEQAKKRPVVVVSRAGFGRPTVRVGVPITGRKAVHALGAWYVELQPDTANGLSKVSSADASQVRALDLARFDVKLGEVQPAQLAAIVAALTLCIEEPPTP